MKKDSISYIAHEATIAALERQLKRQWIALIVAITAFLVSTVTWYIYADGKDYQSTPNCTLKSEAIVPDTVGMKTEGFDYEKRKGCRGKT